MPASISPIYIGSINPAAGFGSPIPQPGARFTEKEYGFDEGERTYLCAPNLPSALLPQRGASDATYPMMFVTDVQPENDESTLIKLSVRYRGIMRQTGGVLKQRVMPGSDTQQFSLSALSSGKKTTIVAPVPITTCTNEYVTTSRPSQQGVGGISGGMTGGAPLPTPAGFSITYTPDPDERLALNYFKNNWVLMARQVVDVVAGRVWQVREFYTYFINIAV